MMRSCCFGGIFYTAPQGPLQHEPWHAGGGCQETAITASLHHHHETINSHSPPLLFRPPFCFVSLSQQACFLFLLLHFGRESNKKQPTTKRTCLRSYQGATSPTSLLTWSHMASTAMGIKRGLVFTEAFSTTSALVLVREDLL